MKPENSISIRGAFISNTCDELRQSIMKLAALAVDKNYVQSVIDYCMADYTPDTFVPTIDFLKK